MTIHRTFALGVLLLGLAACKKDKTDETPAEQPPAKKAPAEKAPAKEVAKPTPPAEPAAPPPRYKGVEPLPMPAPIALTPEEQALVDGYATKLWTNAVHSGVPRAGFEDDVQAALRANPRLLLALLQSPRRDAQVAAGQAIFAYQESGEPLLMPPPEYKPIVFALMTSKDTAVAASVVRSVQDGVRGEHADPDVQALLQRICLDDTRPIVRSVACRGVVEQLLHHFAKTPAAQAVAARALTDEDPHVVYRTLDALNYAYWDAGNLDALIPVLGHASPAIRGLAVGAIARTLESAGARVPAAADKGHALLVAALHDTEPYVRCQAAWGLTSWAYGARWDSVEPMLPLLDDAAAPETTLPFRAHWLDGTVKDDVQWVGVPNPSVADCTLRTLLTRAGNAGDHRLAFEDWDHMATAGRQAFTDWWAANKASLLAPPQL